MSALPDLASAAPAVESAAIRPSLAGLTRAGLSDALGAAGVPERERRMRTNQLWHWIYHRGAVSFDEMTNVSKTLRAVLAERYTLERPEIVTEQISTDGTRKWLIRLPPTEKDKRPHEIEAV